MSERRCHNCNGTAPLYEGTCGMCLYNAICNTLEQNRHLADGENCTLLELKQICRFDEQSQTD